MMNLLKRYWPQLFFILLLVEVGYSFYQHLHISLDGDMAAIILPASWYSQVLEDPFGFSAIFQGEKYGAPNRFFAHWFMGFYFKNVPVLLQHFVHPIDSVYLACALLKIVVQVLIIWLFATFVSGTGRLFNKDFLLAAIVVVPLFQHADYQSTMGIIDGAVTYVCFYALPLGLLLLFFLPFYRAIRSGQDLQLNFFQKTSLAALAVVLAFNGPLVPPVVLVTTFLVLMHFLPNFFIKNNWRHCWNSLPKTMLTYLIFFSLLCVYSLYLGTFNIENKAMTVPLAERYARLPVGLFKQFSLRLGLPLLLGVILVNVVILLKRSRFGEKQKREKADRVLNILKWMVLFCSLFILLLPLGGYRDYRPDIIRRDTIMPVLLCLMFCFGLTACFLLKNLPANLKYWYAAGIAIALVVYTVADINPVLFSNNHCERAAIEKIANSTETIVRLNADCTVMSWNIIDDYRDTELQGKLLQIWRITIDRKYYVQQY